MSTGGQSIPHFDYYLAPGVAKSYIKNIIKVIDIRYSLSKETIEIIKTKLKEYRKEHELILDQSGYEFIKSLLGNYFDIKDIEIIHQKAKEMTDQDTYQAMEALIHNLNTMHCLKGLEKIWVYDTYTHKIELIDMQTLHNTFKPQRYQVISINKDTGKSEFKYITAIQKKDNHRKLVTLTSKTGQKVTTTDNHKVYTVKLNDKNKQHCISKDYLDNITSVLLPRKIELPVINQDIRLNGYSSVLRSNTVYKSDTVKMSNELASLFGYYVADGSIIGNDTTLTFTTCDKVPQDELNQLMLKAFSVELKSSITNYTDKDGVKKPKDFRYTVGVRIGRMFKDKCGDNAHSKHIPNEIMLGNKELKIHFLKSYLRCDGASTKKYLECTTTSDRLAKEIQLLILSLGELPSINKRSKKGLSDKKGSTVNTIILGNKASYRIGLKDIDNTAFEAPKYNLSYMYDYIDNKHKRERKNHAIRYSELESYIKDSGKKELEFATNIFNVDITNKEYSNSEDEYVYDISVQDNENFITEDCIIVSNSRAGDGYTVRQNYAKA